MSISAPRAELPTDAPGPLRLVRHAARAQPGVTLSATEVAQRTGVGRERLRTWERRHGFPVPVRLANNVRRYAASDVRRVLAVKRAVERGTPLSDAIATVIREVAEPAAATLDLGRVVEYAPTPVMAVCGPRPLRVAWLNGAALAVPQMPEAGDELIASGGPVGSAAREAIEQLLLSEAEPTRIIDHPDWGGREERRRSLAWRVPAELSDEPLVVLLQLEPSQPEATPSPATSLAPWVRAVARARQVVQHDRGIPVAQRALAHLANGSGAVDAFLATCHRGELRTATSVRGLLPARLAHLEEEPEVLAAVRSADCTWLSSDARRAIGVPRGVQALVVPMVAGGEIVGIAALAFAERRRLPEGAAELLLGFGGLLAAGLQREHLAARRGGDQGGR